MIEHLNNILSNIDKLFNGNKYIFNIESVNIIRLNILNFKESLEKNNNILNIDLEKLKMISNLIYELNVNNSFSVLTDSISNELYAFEYILQKELKKVY